jgi:hypothetical protein
MRRGARFAVVILLGVLAYVPSLANPLPFDDEYVVVDNPLLETTAGLLHLLTRPGLTGGPLLAAHYRPLPMASLWVERQVFGLSPIAHRLVNLALHLGCALLLYLFVERLLVRLRPADAPERRARVAYLVSLLLAMHPLFSEAVEQVFKRTTTIATACMLAALLAYDACLRVGADDTPRARRLLAAALGFGALGMLAKESAAVMPGLTVVYALVTGELRQRPRAIFAHAAAFAVAPVGLMLAVRPVSAVMQGDHALLRHLLAQPAVFLDYARMAVWSDRVVVAIGIGPAELPPRAADVLGLCLLAALPLSGLLTLRRAPTWSFAVLFAAVCLAPTTLVPMTLVGDPIHLYLAAAGALVLVALVVEALRERIVASVPDSLARVRPLLASVPALLVLLHAFFGTLEVGERYGDSQVLWAHAARIYPDGGFTTGNACATQREPVRAIEVCRHALRVSPGNSFAAMRLVEVLAETGDFAAAEAELGAALQRVGPQWQLQLAEARLALAQGALSRARDAYSAVLAQNPGHIEARVYLADVLLRSGQEGAEALVASLPRASDPITQQMLESVRKRLRQSEGRHR